jgi:hypothetical protein
MRITARQIIEKIYEALMLEKKKEEFSAGTFTLADELFDWKTVEDLEKPHTPRDADNFELQHFKVSPFEWAVAYEAALQALQKGTEPKESLLWWESALPQIGRKGLLRKLGLSQN